MSNPSTVYLFVDCHPPVTPKRLVNQHPPSVPAGERSGERFSGFAGRGSVIEAGIGVDRSFDKTGGQVEARTDRSAAESTAFSLSFCGARSAEKWYEKCRKMVPGTHVPPNLLSRSKVCQQVS